MSQLMDYGTEPAKRPSEIRHLLRCMSVAVIYAAALWVLGTIALEITGGMVLAHEIPGPSSELVYVEGACPIP